MRRKYPTQTRRSDARQENLGAPDDSAIERSPHRRSARSEFPHLQGLSIELRATAGLKPTPGNARTHSERQVHQIAASIEAFGFTNPILIDDQDRIIAGHGRVMAARLLKMRQVPTIRLRHLSEAQKRAYIIADNKIAEKAGWNRELLAIELQGLSDIEINFDLEVTGFDTAEIDFLLDSASDNRENPDDAEPAIDPDKPAVSRLGDLWELGDHRVICGDVRDRTVLQTLMGKERADAVFSDPPYNVKIDGHARGQGRVRHREFAMASGEMSPAQFVEFLEASLGQLADVSRDGSISFICIDWRHFDQLLAASRDIYSELKNVVVWVKENGGMGSFYRSQHELIAVFKVGRAPHQNNFGLGATGRYRTNVWSYAGVNSFKRGRQEELDLHPTVKPVALVADAIKDVTRRGQIVLDGFLGSGTTVIAAERTARRARGVEIDPLYVDAAIERWQRLTGKLALHRGLAKTFNEVREGRRSENPIRTRHRKRAGE